jgi:hypothetical protein
MKTLLGVESSPKFTAGALRKLAPSRTLATTSAILGAGANGIVAMLEVVAPLKREPLLSQALDLTLLAAP